MLFLRPRWRDGDWNSFAILVRGAKGIAGVLGHPEGVIRQICTSRRLGLQGAFLLLLALGGTALFGFGAGCFVDWQVAFLDAVKAGGIVLFSYLICLPTLYVFASIAGCKVGFVRLALVGLVMLFKSPCALDDVATGNWSRLVRFAVVSLLCGLVWEMWNINSFTKWNYAIPYVHHFQYFEMPLLGLFGYIPFGIECLVITDVWMKRRFAAGCPAA